MKPVICWVLVYPANIYNGGKREWKREGRIFPSKHSAMIYNKEESPFAGWCKVIKLSGKAGHIKVRQ